MSPIIKLTSLLTPKAILEFVITPKIISLV